MRGDFLQDEEMKAPQLCLTDVILHQRWRRGAPLCHSLARAAVY